MGRTISSRELKAGLEEYAVKYNSTLLAQIAEGKRVPKTNDTLSVKESLISKTTSKARIVSNVELFAPYFKKYAGKKAPTAEIFEMATGKTAKNESELSA